MSTRYVFGQYNVKTTAGSTSVTGYSVASSTSSSSTSSTFTTKMTSTGYGGVRTFYVSASNAAKWYDTTATLYNVSDFEYSSTVYSNYSYITRQDTLLTAGSSGGGSVVYSGSYVTITYAVLNSSDTDDVSVSYSMGLWYSPTITWGSDCTSFTVTGYKVSFTTSTTSTTYSQGTTFYNYLYGDSSSAYTTGRNTSGDYRGYWITYVGTDSITPTLKITKSGYKMTSTITASSSATYGGDIYYKLETACNDGDYAEVQDSTSTTYTETVGSDTAYYYSRVTAYCDGFEDSAVTASYTIGQTGTRYVWDQLDEEGGTSQGYVSSSSLSTYPLDAEDDDGYWYDYLGSDTPDATAVTATTTGKAGATVTLKITAAGSSSNVYGGTIYYTIKRYRRKSSSASYTYSTISSRTTSTSVTTTIPTGGYYDCYYTVTTSDNYGYTGTTVVKTSTITIINNEAPEVSISSIGTVTGAFDISFAISDDDGDTMSATLALDGTTLQTWSGQSDGTLTYSVDDDTVLKLLNGSHTVSVAVSDGSETTTATATFTKAVYTCSATWLAAKSTSAIITKCYIGYVGSIPDDATVSMLVTNDNGVTWEDATDAFLDGETYLFTTSSVTTPAFNFLLTVTRGDTEGYVDDLMFLLSTGEASEYGNTVATLVHIESGSVHAFTGLNGRTGMIPVQFKSTSAYEDGESATLDGDAITVQTVTGDEAYFAANVGVMAVVDTEDATMTLQM